MLAAELTTQRQLVLNLLWFAFNFQTAALLPVVVPAQVLLIVASGSVGSAEQAAYLGRLAAVAAVIAVFLQPLVGLLSDRTRTAWGRRRPHIVWGTAIMLLGAAGLTRASDPWSFAAAFLVLQAGNSAAIAAYQGLLPDLVPRRQRGSASGFLGLMTILGNAASLGLAALLLGEATAGRPAVITSGAAAYYTITIAGLALACGVTVAGIAEPPASGPRRKAMQSLSTALRAWLEPWRSRNYTWVFVARLLVIMGLTLFMTFIEYYFARVAHVTNFVQATAAVALIALLVAVFGAVGLGRLSDRIPRVPLAFASTLVMALAAVLFWVGGGNIPLWWLGGVFGLGYGAYWSVDWALAVDSLPSIRAAGRDLGLWSLASTVPGMAAPALGSLIIGAGASLGRTEAGYQGVFIAAAVFFLLGAVAVLGIREEARELIIER
ncbi:MAG TPA: MFS transporter [Candidatus Dormibacteraeota bacterium]|nr:MFS transporter [Candidatus Dormibacteraeota bacterium]